MLMKYPSNCTHVCSRGNKTTCDFANAVDYGVGTATFSEVRTGLGGLGACGSEGGRGCAGSEAAKCSNKQS